MYLITDRIERLYNKNTKFKESIDNRLVDNDARFYITTKSISDYLLQYNESFNFSNYPDHFYDQLLELNDNDFMYFVSNTLRNKYKLNETIYNHIKDNIFNSLSNRYDMDINLIKENRNILENKCEILFESGDISGLYKIRKFLTDNFRLSGFNSFLKENKSAALKILKSKDIEPSNKKFIRIEQLLKDHPGYLGVFTYFAFKSNISYNRLKELYARILKNRSLIRTLPKNIIDYHRIEELDDDLDKLERLTIAKKYANEYPGLRLIRNNPDFIELANAVNDKTKSDKGFGEAYEVIFLPKVSLYKTQDQLIKALRSFIVNYSFNDFYDKVSKNSNIKKVYDSDRFLVLRYLDFPELKETCSDTSWCIARDLDYWLSYHGQENSIFIVIVDKMREKFDVKSRIGVTFYEGGGFNTAHLKNDSYINSTELNKILESDGIDLSLLYDEAKKLGTNRYYDVTTDEYGNITGYDE